VAPTRSAHRITVDVRSAVRINMARRRGRAKRGHRLVKGAPHRHWKTTTFVGALRCDGLTAPLAIDGAINGELFLAYVEQVPLRR
jgi:hypothetical protein